MSSARDKKRAKSTGWLNARREIEEEIARTAARLHALEESAKIVEQKIAAGEPWPGEEHQHAA